MESSKTVLSALVAFAWSMLLAFPAHGGNEGAVTPLLAFTSAPSVSFRIPESCLRFSENLGAYYGDADAIISYALLRNGYDDRAYYVVPAGFALVTRMEKIDAHGQSLPPKQRWALKLPPVNPLTDRTACLSVLENATPGYYRVLVFIVTSAIVAPGQPSPQGAGMERPFEDGARSLPAEVIDRSFTSRDHCTALIYTFRKSGNVVMLEKSGNPEDGELQLQKAGIWRYLAH
ncbi:MAG: hypothetical protein HGB15_09230 [Chlorobaculum sp.]|nr:hypothetical protein [Chlorobaculum sp.]